MKIISLFKAEQRARIYLLKMGFMPLFIDIRLNLFEDFSPKEFEIFFKIKKQKSKLENKLFGIIVFMTPEGRITKLKELNSISFKRHLIHKYNKEIEYNNKLKIEFKLFC